MKNYFKAFKRIIGYSLVLSLIPAFVAWIASLTPIFSYWKVFVMILIIELFFFGMYKVVDFIFAIFIEEKKSVE